MHVTTLFGVSINPDMETRAVVLQKERWAGVFPGQWSKMKYLVGLGPQDVQFRWSGPQCHVALGQQ